MGQASLVSQMHSVVILGDFNPIIFHPSWFSSNKLLDETETEAAVNPLVSREVATYKVADISIQVDQQKLGISTTSDAQIPIVRDLAYGCLSLLEHTPLRALGLNIEFEYAFTSEEKWHQLGHQLAPKEIWEAILIKPGMRQISITGTRAEGGADNVLFRVFPSIQNKHGAVIAVNQHYNLPRETVRLANTKALQILTEYWVEFLSFAKTSAEKIISITD